MESSLNLDQPIAPMSSRIELTETEEKANPLPPLHLRVSKTEFILEVVQDDKALHRFPIGLGISNSTPEGDFRVANKLRDPQWYNKGNPIPPGDPKNPLGKQWLGLGQGGSPTPYGIHPTQEEGSIGENQSQGCIRMRPQDAEIVFQLCPIGTPVRIQ